MNMAAGPPVSPTSETALVAPRSPIEGFSRVEF
jgi:hypothetical protein